MTAEFAITITVAETLPVELYPDDLTLSLVETAVIQALKNHLHQPRPPSISLLLADDATIQKLNRDFLGSDQPTDVLSFPAGDSMPGMTVFDSHLGDIIISVPFAIRQAAGAGHQLAVELQLLAVHGTLHLLGYVHGDLAEKTEMWGVQTTVLEQLGLGAIQLTES